MRNCGIFEPNKFHGQLHACKSNELRSAQELFDVFSKADDGCYRVSGVIIPNGDALVYSTCKVFSTGEKWTTIEAICESFGSNLQYLEEANENSTPAN